MFHSGKVLYKYNMPFVNLTICVMCICDSSLTFMIVSKQFLFHLHSGIFNFTSKNSLYSIKMSFALILHIARPVNVA